MKIIPAIDLLDGKVVRLTRGDPSLSKIYSNNPVDEAKKWKDQGAEYLHIVDLSAALGRGDNADIIKLILKEVDMKIEVGGGIRNKEKAKEFVSLGAQRIIVGTKSLDENFLEDLLQSVGSDKLAVSADIIDSHVAVCGWQEKSSYKTLDFIEYLKGLGIKWLIYTDISRDGTLEGINIEDIKRISSFENLNVIISGGISSVDDVTKIKKEAPSVWGVIIGKALYEDKIDLATTLKAI